MFLLAEVKGSRPSTTAVLAFRSFRVTDDIEAFTTVLLYIFFVVVIFMTSVIFIVCFAASGGATAGSSPPALGPLLPGLEILPVFRDSVHYGFGRAVGEYLQS
jgi:hypothetical protein